VDGWVDVGKFRTHIIGHWNYADTTVKDVHVVSPSDKVELFLNGKSLGFGERNYHFLHTFKKVSYQKGVLKAGATMQRQNSKRLRTENRRCPYGPPPQTDTQPTGSQSRRRRYGFGRSGSG